ncbi:hypothetical protein D3C73_899100 [compost metagenome]
MFQVIGDEVREFLGLAHAGVDGQAARGLAVLAFLAHGAEVAGPQERGEIAVGVLARVQSEPGKAEVGRQLTVLQPALAVVERSAVIGQFLRLAVDHVVHAHRRMEVQAQMEELGLEFSRLVGPQGMVLAVADRLVLIPVQRLQLARQHPLVALVRRLCERARLALQGGEIERLRLAKPAQPKLATLAGRTGRQ